MTPPADVAWSSWVLFGVQILTLVFLAIYVMKTWEMASASKAMVEESYEARMESLAPKVLVYFDTDSVTLAEIVVENCGTGTAGNVIFSFDPPLQSSQGEEPERFFSNPKSIIPPGSRFKHFLDAWPSYLKAEMPRRYRVTVTYEGIENQRSYEVEHVLDVSDHEHRQEIKRKDLDDLVRAFESAQNDIKRGMRAIARQQATYHGRERYKTGPYRNLSSALKVIQLKWHLLRELSLNGSYEVDWHSVLEDVRGDAVNAMYLAKAKDIDDEEERSIMTLGHALLSRARPGDEEWYTRVEEALNETPELDGRTGA